MISSNNELPERLDALIESKSINWVLAEQPVSWQPDRWKADWQKYSLPFPHVLDELESEIRQHKTIRREFIFETYQDRSATELFIAAMA